MTPGSSWQSGIPRIDSAQMRVSIGVMLMSVLSMGCGESPAAQEESPVPEIEVTIPGGATAVQIGRELRAVGLVYYPRAFALTARVMGSEGSLKAGRYRFPLDSSWFEML